MTVAAVHEQDEAFSLYFAVPSRRCNLEAKSPARLSTSMPACRAIFVAGRLYQSGVKNLKMPSELGKGSSQEVGGYEVGNACSGRDETQSSGMELMLDCHTVSTHYE